MKTQYKYILIIICIALIGGLFWYYKTQSQSSTSSATATLSDVATWQTFQSTATTTSASNDVIPLFSFKYPPGWTAVLQQTPQGPIPWGRAIVWLYAPDISTIIAACKNQYPTSTPLPGSRCDKMPSEATLALWEDRYVNYNSSDTIQSNYPDYQIVSVPGLDIFAYNGDAQGVLESYHINFPNKTGGLGFSIYDPVWRYSEPDADKVLQGIVQTFRFK